MEYMIITLLAVASVLLVAYPLLAGKRGQLDFESIFSFGDVKQQDYLNAKKALVLENIKELDFEYEMGKLSDEDYSKLRQDYLGEAQDVVKALDELQIRREIEDLIENDVRNRRRVE